MSSTTPDPKDTPNSDTKQAEAPQDIVPRNISDETNEQDTKVCRSMRCDKPRLSGLEFCQGCKDSKKAWKRIAQGLCATCGGPREVTNGRDCADCRHKIDGEKNRQPRRIWPKKPVTLCQIQGCDRLAKWNNPLCLQHLHESRMGMSLKSRVCANQFCRRHARRLRKQCTPCLKDMREAQIANRWKTSANILIRYLSRTRKM